MAQRGAASQISIRLANPPQSTEGQVEDSHS